MIENDIGKNISGASILIVDDVIDNVDRLEMMLESAGYENVIGITDSRDVEGHFRSRRIDLLLLDIRMPHIDGFQIMERLSSLIRDDYLPVLVLTAQQDRETRMRALDLGAKDFLTKPFDHFETLIRIRNLLEVRMLYNERRRQAEILEEKVKDRTREVEAKAQDLLHAQIEIIRTLARVSEYRDNETGRHIVRVAKTSRLLALACGLDEDEAAWIELAAPLHDIGKVGIPDHILLKPGCLNEDEMAVMKSHSKIGGMIFGNYQSKVIEKARIIAESHHEKWDGSGYPYGLRGEDISIEARIVTVADVFDALLSNRPYKKAWSVDNAVAFINDQAAKHFDPTVVRAFNNILPQILLIQMELRDA